MQKFVNCISSKKYGQHRLVEATIDWAYCMSDLIQMKDPSCNQIWEMTVTIIIEGKSYICSFNPLRYLLT